MTPGKIRLLTAALLLCFALTWVADFTDGYNLLKVIIAMISPVSPGYSLTWLTDDFRWSNRYDSYESATICLLLLLAGWLTYRLTRKKNTRLLQIAFAVLCIKSIADILMMIAAMINYIPAAWPITLCIIAGRGIWVYFSYKGLQATRKWNRAADTHFPALTEATIAEANAPSIDRLLHLIIDASVICFLLAPFNLHFFSDAFMTGIFSGYTSTQRGYRLVEIYRFGMLCIFYSGLRMVYYLFFEYLFAATPGKMLTGACVVPQKGGTMSFRQVGIRTFARFIPFNILSFLMDGWHDHVSKTRIVKNKKEKHTYVWTLIVLLLIVAGQSVSNKLIRALYRQQNASYKEQAQKLMYAGVQEGMKHFDTTCYLRMDPVNYPGEFDPYHYYKVAALLPDSIVFHAYKSDALIDGEDSFKIITTGRQSFEHVVSSCEEWEKGIVFTDSKKRYVIKSVFTNSGPVMNALPVHTDRDNQGWLEMYLHIEHWQPGKVQMQLKEGQVLEEGEAFSEHKLVARGKYQQFTITFKRHKGVFRSYFTFTAKDGRQYKLLVVNIATPFYESGYTQVNRVYE